MEVEKTRKKSFHTDLDKYASRLVLYFNGPARELTGGRHQDFWPRVITSPRDAATLHCFILSAGETGDATKRQKHSAASNAQ